MPVFLFLLVISLASGCGYVETPRVFYLNSYHPGYPPSDSVEAALVKTVSGRVTLSRFHLNTKRISGIAADSMAEKALAAINAFEPQILIASDDDAVKIVVLPYLQQAKTPVVFCGVNWSAASYHLPRQQVTGMVEVLPLAQTIILLKKYYPASRKLVVLSENSVSEQANTLLLDTLYRRLGLEPEYRLVADFAAWKTAFAESMERADLVYLPTNGGIAGWNEAAAKSFVTAQIRKPVFTCDEFMMPYAVLGFTKVASEQGTYAGETALRILAGVKPAAIPVAANQQQIGWWNPVLAEKINFQPGDTFFKTLQQVH